MPPTLTSWPPSLAVPFNSLPVPAPTRAGVLGATSGVVLDPLFRDARLHEVRHLSATGSLEALLGLLHGSESQTWCVEALQAATLTPSENLISHCEAVVAHTPAHSVARLLLGYLLTKRAWDQRTSRDLRLVSAAPRQFHDDLIAAEEQFTKIVRTDHRFAPAWVGLLTTGRGLGVSRYELMDLFSRCSKAAPQFGPAITAMVQGLSAKWGGDDTAMLSFAHAISAEALAGSPAHDGLALAVFEASLNRPDPEFRSWATTMLRHGILARGLSQPGALSGREMLRSASWFALAAYSIGDADTARVLMSRIGLDPARVSGAGWQYFGDPFDAFHAAGHELGLW